jgi:tetratricopeptide (TPR) repeat protein
MALKLSPLRILATLALGLSMGGSLAACSKPSGKPEVTAEEAAAALAGGEGVDAEKGIDNVAQDLLDKLTASSDGAVAASLEEEVYSAWLVSGSPTVDILMKRATDAQESEDLELARDMYDRALMIRPEYAEAWNRRALLFFNDGKYDEAIADLETTLQYEPRHFGAWIGLAMIFESMDYPDAALKAYRKALMIHPFAEAAKQGEKRLIPIVEGRAL